MSDKAYIGLFLRFCMYDAFFILLSSGDLGGTVFQWILIASACLCMAGSLYFMHKANKEYTALETKVNLLFDQHWIEDETGVHRRDVFEGKEHKDEE